MKVYTKILGNSHSPEWQARLEGASIDYIDLDQWNAQKSRLLAIGTSGKPYAFSFERGHKLSDGDIVEYDHAHASIVRLTLGDVMVVELSSLMQRPPSEAIPLAIEIGHALGNQHWAVLIRDESLLVPLTVDKKVMLSVMRTYNFDGISISFHPGSEIIPYLTPSEIRTLFGSTAPENHHSHHSHHPHLDEYV